MASRSASRRRGRADHDYDDDEGGVGAFLARHRLAVGGLTAFAVIFSYVAANAIWYQPHAHGGAFFETRPQAASTTAAPDGSEEEAAGGETIIRLERESQPPEPLTPGIETAATVPVPREVPVLPVEVPVPPAGDPVVSEVQRILAGLGFYDGEVDGLTGPQTRAAIRSYRRTVGLSESAEIDDHLLNQLGATPRAASAAPPLPRGSPGTDMIETSSAVARGDAMVMRIQAGLRAFGNDGIEIDGVVGPRTKAAIHEFQALFGLPETGEPDEALYDKMRDIGLTD